MTKDAFPVYEVTIQTAYGELLVSFTSPRELTEDEAFDKACEEAKDCIDWSKLGELRVVG